MKIFVVHNTYQGKGGEDSVVAEETAMLKNKGHTVIEFIKTNRDIYGFSFYGKIQTLNNMKWSKSIYHEMRQYLTKEKPDIVHVHNIFFVISPSVYYACAECNVPVVQTLHNYRMLCSCATFFRKNKICERCIHGNFGYSLLYGCWRNSRILNCFVVRMLRYHYKIGTFREKIDKYIAPTNFSKQKFIEGGIPVDKIVVKPNFVNDEYVFRKKTEISDYVLFVGRLSEEKGVWELVKAWKGIDFKLKIAGDGHLKNELVSFCVEHKINVEFLGYVQYVDLKRYLAKCLFLIFPSLCYETFGRVLVEAYAASVPVAASKLGVMPEIVLDGLTGILFNSYDINDMRMKIRYLLGDKKIVANMRERARAEYDDKYSSERNYKMLMKIYEDVIHKRK